MYIYPIAAGSPPSSEELPSIERFQTASLLGLIALLVSTVAGVIALVYLRGAIIVAGPANTVSISSNVIPLLWFSAGTEAISFAILIGSLYFYRQAFVGLRARASTFSTPATLAALAMIGALILIVGTFVEVQYTVQLINCLNQSGATVGSCSGGRLLLAALGLVGVGRLMFVIGWIGVLIGIWRIGVRYATDLPRIGAVLFLFPYINWSGMIFNYVGASRIRTNLRCGSGPGPGGSS